MKNITLFKALDLLTLKNGGKINKDLIEEIKDTLDSKLFDIEFSEPNSDGDAYDRWTSKYGDLDYIVSCLKFMCDDIDNVTEKDINDLKDCIYDYQDEYKGLKTLKILLFD